MGAEFIHAAAVAEVGFGAVDGTVLAHLYGFTFSPAAFAKEAWRAS